MENPLRAHKWLVRNHDKVRKYEGKWVAVSPNGIFAAAESLAKLCGKLDESQKAQFPMLRIPTRKEAANIIL